MKRRDFVLGMATCPLCAAAALAEGAAPHWSYEGHGGTKDWGELSSNFKACAVGSEQSPIDLKNPVGAKLDPLVFNWTPEAYEIANNGHTIQADAKAAGALMVGTVKYSLLQFHFHTPSEHALEGKRAAMEAHFVHRAEDGRLGVVGVLMQPGAAGNAAFSAIMAAAPAKEGKAALKAPLDPAALLPKGRDYYRYEGSLTTPPCSEIANWMVFAEPITIAQADADAFKALFPMNARPLQPMNRRFLLKGS